MFVTVQSFSHAVTAKYRKLKVRQRERERACSLPKKNKVVHGSNHSEVETTSLKIVEVLFPKSTIFLTVHQDTCQHRWI